LFSQYWGRVWGYQDGNHKGGYSPTGGIKMSQLQWLTELSDRLEMGISLIKADHQEAGFTLLRGVLAEVEGERETVMRMEEDDD
jgi:hypothetical protein